MGKKNMANGASKKSIQAMGDLTKTPYNSLITNAVLKSVEKTVAAIDKVLIGEKKVSVNLGVLLAKLKIEIFNKLNSTSKVSNYQARVAFHNFIQVRFKIGENRANEYIRLSERKDLHRLGLSTSVLIELSRLDSETLKVFIKKHPTGTLKKLPFKEIKNLVKGDNGNKRNTSVKTVEKKEPELIADKLKHTFEIVKSKFDDEPELDKGLDSVLGEISKWYIDKKAA